MVGVLLAIARWMADTRPWRVFFIVSAMVTLFFVVAIVLMGHIASLFSISSIDVLYGGIGLVDAALPMVVLCFALWGDLRAGRKRHFTHWLGVAGWLTMTVSTCIIFAMMLAGLGPRAG